MRWFFLLILILCCSFEVNGIDEKIKRIAYKFLDRVVEMTTIEKNEELFHPSFGLWRSCDGSMLTRNETIKMLSETSNRGYKIELIDVSLARPGLIFLKVVLGGFSSDGEYRLIIRKKDYYNFGLVGAQCL